MVNKETYFYPCRAPYVKIKKKDKEALEAFQKEDQDILASVFEKLAELIPWLVDGTGEKPYGKSEVQEHLREFYPELRVLQNDPVMKTMPNWIKIRFRECPDCDHWHVLISLDMHVSDSVGSRLKPTVLLQGGNDTPFKITNFTP